MLHQHVFVNLTVIVTPSLYHHHRAGHHSSLHHEAPWSRAPDTTSSTTMHYQRAGHHFTISSTTRHHANTTAGPIRLLRSARQTKWKGTTATLHVMIFHKTLKGPWKFSKQKAQGESPLSPLWGNALTATWFGDRRVAEEAWHTILSPSPSKPVSSEDRHGLN